MTLNASPTGLAFSKTSLTEQAYGALRRMILDQQLRPGERLNIYALSRLHAVSSSPLREALVRLEAEGLVVFTANTGFSVAPLPGAEQMHQLLEFRLLMETHCARAGAGKGDADVISELTRATEAMAAMRRAGVGYDDYQAYFGLEQAFHQCVIESAGNAPIATAYRALDLILYVARRSIVRESGKLGSDEAVQEHRAIVAAYAARDPDGAAAAIQRHLAAARVRMEAQENPRG